MWEWGVRSSHHVGSSRMILFSTKVGKTAGAKAGREAGRKAGVTAAAAAALEMGRFCF